MIDEDTHLSRRGEPRVIGSVPLLETCTHRSLLRPCRNCFRVGPQEPRRPRFSFFHLHAVKELTSGPAGGRRPWKPGFLILGNSMVLPVARQHTCPFRKSAEQWERPALGVVSVGGL